MFLIVYFVIDQQYSYGTRATAGLSFPPDNLVLKIGTKKALSVFFPNFALGLKGSLT